MKPASWVKRIAVTLLLGCVFVLVAGPRALYWVALSGIEGSPELPTSSASAQERQEIWQKLRGTGEPIVTSISLIYSTMAWIGGAFQGLLLPSGSPEIGALTNCYQRLQKFVANMTANITVNVAPSGRWTSRKRAAHYLER